MAIDAAGALNLSQLSGEPFFAGAPEHGRHVYILKSHDTGTFVAFGTVDGTHKLLFKVTEKDTELPRFLEEVKKEGAHVTFGAPPFETNNTGDKSKSTTTPPGRTR